MAPREQHGRSEQQGFEELRACLLQFPADKQLAPVFIQDAIMRGPSSPKWLFDRMGAHPLVSRALTLAGRSAEARSEAIAVIADAYRHYLTELPLWQEPDEPRWKPTVLGPDGMLWYLYVLRRLDAVETLPLLASVIKKVQQALHESYRGGGQRPPLGDDVYVGSDHGFMLSYACDHFLRRYKMHKELLETCTPQQRAVLDEYAAYCDEVVKQTGTQLDPEYGLPELGERQTEVMKHAVRFVEAGPQEQGG